MMRTFLLGALAATAIGFAAPAQASMANPGLGAAASANVEQAQYYGHRRHRHWRAPYWRGYAYYPRRCWTERVIRWDGRVRYIRRCR